MKKLSLITLLCLPVFLSGTILHVPEEYASIQTAIYSHEAGDTILVAPGIYHENIHIPGGDLTLASMFLLTNDTSFISQTILDGGAIGRVLFIHGSDAVSTVCGFTIRNGYTTEFGAGLCISNASPVIHHCVIADNIVENDEKGGGGIACFTHWWGTTAPRIYNVVVKNNTAINGLGGGMYCEQEEVKNAIRNVAPRLENVFFINNTAGKSGGGLACWGYSGARLENVQFIENNALLFDGGGLVVHKNASCRLFDVVFNKNVCHENGGAIHCDGGNLTLNNVLIQKNFAKFGGGLFAESTFISRINNVLFEYNTAEMTGGGFYCNKAYKFFIKNVTFVENYADAGTAIYSADGSHITMTSCILFGNKPQQIVCASTLNPSILDISYSNIQGGINFVETNDNGTIEWGEGNLNRNPNFIGSGDYPFQLNDYSPCIDAGSPDTTDLTGTLDLAGEIRLFNDRVDMGSYEWNLFVGIEKPFINTTKKIIEIYPNPFSTTTTIQYQLQQPQTIQISIFNHLGKQVHFIQEKQAAGKQQMLWDASGLPSGMYYFTIQIGNEMAKGKMVVSR